MNSLHHAATRRNTLKGGSTLLRDHQPIAFRNHPCAVDDLLSPGARAIYRRTLWSASRCNAAAEAWNYGLSNEGCR
jgi:hypothetical protein